jgi:hypothetical protein
LMRTLWFDKFAGSEFEQRLAMAPTGQGAGRPE